MDQRACLVEVGSAEADAHHRGRERNSALEQLVFAIEFLDLRAPQRIVRANREPVDQFGQDEIIDPLAVVGGLAAVTVEVHSTHFEGIKTKMMGDIENGPLDSHDALRNSEPTKRRVRDRMRAAAKGFDPHVLEIIGIVAVENSTIGNGRRQIETVAAAKPLHEPDAENPSPVIEPYVVVDLELVALAGHHHVVVAIET